MMKKNIIIAIIICIGLTTKYNGQIGVGADTPNTSAILDVFSTNKGFLPPRVALTNINDVATIPSPATELLVYNTAVNGYVRIGYQLSVNNGYNSSFTFTSANFNVWQNIDSPATSGNTLGFHGSLASPQRDRFHEFVLSLSYNEFVNLVINSY